MQGVDADIVSPLAAEMSEGQGGATMIDEGNHRHSEKEDFSDKATQSSA